MAQKCTIPEPGDRVEIVTNWHRGERATIVEHEDNTVMNAYPMWLIQLADGSTFWFFREDFRVV